MIHINLLSNRQNTLSKNKRLSRGVILLAALAAFVTGSCTSTKSTAPKPGDLVEANPALSSEPELQDVPEELRFALRFDPAQTLDPKTVEESEFYQIKKAIEQNRSIIEAAWKEQEAIEARVRAAIDEEKMQKAEIARQEEAELNRKRKNAADEYERTKDLRAKYEKEANERAKKLPTISRDYEVWKGLED